MKTTIRYAIAMAAILHCSDLALSQAVSSAAAPSNQFAVGFGIYGNFDPDRMKLEDVSSPFTAEHVLEQSVYGFLYNQILFWHSYPEGSFERKYAVFKERPTVELPPDRDAAARPLWFDGRNGLEALQFMVAKDFMAGFYDNLEAIYARWNNTDERTADGRLKIQAFQFPDCCAATSQWEATYRRLKGWREKSPTSVVAAIFEAEYWLAYAGDARGTGYANSVSVDAWSLYRERLLRARQVLLESEPFAGTSPLWHETQIRVAAGLAIPTAQLLQISDKATKNSPDYSNLYSITGAYLVPKWGGSWKMVESFARKSLEARKSADGRSLYTRIYSTVSRAEENPNIFEYAEVNWSDIKVGFNEMVRLYPHSVYNLNRFAAFACMAGDKDTFQALRFRIGKLVDTSQWPMNYSIDLCEHKFALQPL